MIGAIVGDIIGSRFERNNKKSIEFELFNAHCTFTDDTVMTIAIADALMNNKGLVERMQYYGRKHFSAGYGSTFRHWLINDNPTPYNSWGNGSAMRVSSVGYLYQDINKVLEIAKQTAEVSHNHPEGVKGAQAIAAAIFLARNNHSKTQIKQYIQKTFEYNLQRTIEAIRPSYKFDVSCQGSVPEAIIAFLESNDIESAIRLGISIGGDSDTIACMAGAIAEAYYKYIPKEIIEATKQRLKPDLLAILEQFYQHIDY